MRLAAVLLLASLLLAGCSSGDDEADGVDTAGAEAALEPRSEVFSGTLTAASPAATVAFDVPADAAGAGRLAFTLVMPQAVPQTSLAMTVVAPDGEEAGHGSTSPFLYAFPGTRPTFAQAAPVEGSWSVTIELSGAVGEWELHACHDTAEDKGPDSNFACQRYG